MFSVGVLVFLLVDVLAHGFEIAEEAVTASRTATRQLRPRRRRSRCCSVGGFAVGQRRAGHPRAPHAAAAPRLPPIAGGATEALTVERPPGAGGPGQRRPGAGAADRADHRRRDRPAQLRRGPGDRRLRRAGEIGLATVLIIGFALHNATEGFGIVGPLGDVKPSWRWLALAGLIGGGPTFLGSMVGYNVTSEPLELVFYAVAGGAILYVIGEIWHGMRRYGHRELGLLLLAAGFAAGVLTDLVVAYGGG